MILDEPESGLAIHVQANIFRLIDKRAKENNLQIIVATHSPFALLCEANFIELQPGYIKIAKQEIELLSVMLKIQDKIQEKEKAKKNQEAGLENPVEPTKVEKVIKKKKKP